MESLFDTTGFKIKFISDIGTDMWGCLAPEIGVIYIYKYDDNKELIPYNELVFIAIHEVTHFVLNEHYGNLSHNNSFWALNNKKINEYYGKRINSRILDRMKADEYFYPEYEKYEYEM